MKPRTARAANAVQKRPLFPGIGRNVVMVLLGTPPRRRGKAPAIISRGANLAPACVTEMAELTPESPPEAPQMRRLIGEVSRTAHPWRGGIVTVMNFFHGTAFNRRCVRRALRGPQLLQLHRLQPRRTACPLSR